MGQGHQPSMGQSRRTCRSRMALGSPSSSEKRLHASSFPVKSSAFNLSLLALGYGCQTSRANAEAHEYTLRSLKGEHSHRGKPTNISLGLNYYDVFAHLLGFLFGSPSIYYCNSTSASLHFVTMCCACLVGISSSLGADDTRAPLHLVGDIVRTSRHPRGGIISFRAEIRFPTLPQSVTGFASWYTRALNYLISQMLFRCYLISPLSIFNI